MNRKHGKLKKLESLLPDVARSLGIESRMKELLVMNYWCEIVKGNVAKDSKPHSIIKTKKGLTLCVAAKSSIVMQELNIIKIFLLDKLNTLSSQVGLTINDIFVSTKYWQEVNASEAMSALNKGTLEDKHPYDDIDIESLILTPDQKASVEEIIAQLDCDDEFKIKLRQIMHNDLKLKLYKKQQGYPVCKKCGVYLNRIGEEYCPSCKY